MQLSARELMEIAHEVAVECFGENSFNFASIWAKTWTRAKNFKKENIKDWIGTFYTELLMDSRFVCLGPDKWKLREYMDYNEYLSIMGKRISASSLDIKELEDEDKNDKSTSEVSASQNTESKQDNISVESENSEIKEASLESSEENYEIENVTSEETAETEENEGEDEAESDVDQDSYE